MSQIFEALRRAEDWETARRRMNDVATSVAPDRRQSERRSVEARIRVYGHGQGMSPFFEENSILEANETGALLLMRTPVFAGQKLLLINEDSEQVQECHVLRTACRSTIELEVAVAFPARQPAFWNRGEKFAVEKRKQPRVALPRGMGITWRGRGEPVLSKVDTLSAGGLSIVAPEPPPTGELIHVSFEVPAGEVSAQTIVRHSHEGKGMGVEFLAISDQARARLNHLLQKLLG
jgi:hypothetical protein